MIDDLVGAAETCGARVRATRVGALGVLAAVIWFGGPAAGIASATTTVTTTFSSPGSYSFTVPAGVSSITVTAVGAAGGNESGLCNASGGEGASLSATLAVSPGEQLFLGVGAPGRGVVCSSASGGAGGSGGGGSGGSGGSGANGGGAGGGASLVGVPSPSPAFGPLLIAGGGGGGGGGGGNGGNAEAPGTETPGPAPGGAGGAGTATSGGGGTAGSCGGCSAGTAGSFGLGGGGGSGGSGSDAGGGGGGGYYGGGGGGGGANAGGGGGGSSFVVQGSTNVVGPTPTSASPEVSITYPVPTADENTGAVTFATQPQGTVSAEQALTVTNNGSAPLIVSGVLLSGPDPGDYLIDDGCQQPVAVSSSCTVEVRFAPQSQGASSATLTLLTNAATAPVAVALSGTGGSLPQGPPGTDGTNGTNGTAGKTGSQGPPGKVELITCKSAIKKVKGHRRRVQKCTGPLVSGTVKFTAAGAAVLARISRAGTVYATGASVPTGRGGMRLLLTNLRPLHCGSYTLSLRTRRGHRRATRRVPITIC